jgi:hypothetical protein
MDPIFCLKESDASKGSSCLLSQKNMLFYPFMLTVDPTDFSECKCSPSGDATLNENEFVRGFRFLIEAASKLDPPLLTSMPVERRKLKSLFQTAGDCP